MSYNSVNANLRKSQISKLKQAAQHGTDVTLRLSKSALGSGPHVLLLTNTQVNKINKHAKLA